MTRPWLISVTLACLAVRLAHIYPSSAPRDLWEIHASVFKRRGVRVPNTHRPRPSHPHPRPPDAGIGERGRPPRRVYRICRPQVRPCPRRPLLPRRRRRGTAGAKIPSATPPPSTSGSSPAAGPQASAPPEAGAPAPRRNAPSPRWSPRSPSTACGPPTPPLSTPSTTSPRPRRVTGRRTAPALVAPGRFTLVVRSRAASHRRRVSRPRPRVVHGRSRRARVAQTRHVRRVGGCLRRRPRPRPGELLRLHVRPCPPRGYPRRPQERRGGFHPTSRAPGRVRWTEARGVGVHPWVRVDAGGDVLRAGRGYRGRSCGTSRARGLSVRRVRDSHYDNSCAERHACAEVIVLSPEQTGCGGSPGPGPGPALAGSAPTESSAVPG